MNVINFPYQHKLTANDLIVLERTYQEMRKLESEYPAPMTRKGLAFLEKIND